MADTLAIILGGAAFALLICAGWIISIGSFREPPRKL